MAILSSEFRFNGTSKEIDRIDSACFSSMGADAISQFTIQGANTYGFRTGAVSAAGTTIINTGTAGVNYTVAGAWTATAGGVGGLVSASLEKQGLGAIIFANNAVNSTGPVTATGGIIRIDGTSSMSNNNFIVLNPNTTLADNTTTGQPFGTGTVNLRLGAAYRIDQNKFTLPTLTTGGPIVGASESLLALSIASYSQTVTMPAGQDLFLGVGTISTVYTGGTIVPNGTLYQIGGATAAAQTLTLTGNGTNPVLADNGGSTSVQYGSQAMASLGTVALTVALNNPITNPNTYTGETRIALPITVNVSTGGAATPFGNGGNIRNSGTLTFSGANGSAINAGNTGNNNLLINSPGSSLIFDSTTASSVTGGRWHDTTAINLNSTTLQLRGTSNVATSETVGDISYDGISTINLTRTGTGAANLIGGTLSRIDRGVLKITTGATNGIINSNSETLTFATLPAQDVNTQNIFQGHMIAVGNGTTAPSFVIDAGGGVLAPLATANYSANILGTSSTASDTVDITANLTLAANGSAYGIRLGADLLTNQATVGYGGVIVAGAAGTRAISTRLAFGSSESLIYTNTGVTGSLNFSTAGAGGITGTNGLTKSGPGTLTFNLPASSTFTTAPALSGTITINEGTLSVITASGLTGAGQIGFDPTSNIVMNGGTLLLRKDNSTTYANSLTLRNSAAYNIDRSNTAATGQNMISGGHDRGAYQ
jgi:hypothetical protein